MKYAEHVQALVSVRGIVEDSNGLAALLPTFYWDARVWVEIFARLVQSLPLERLLTPSG